MSGRLRLRLAGEPSSARLPVADDDARIALPAPTIAVVGAVDGSEADPFAERLAEAATTANASVAVWSVALRSASGSERRDRGPRTFVYADAATVGAAIEHLARAPATHALRIAIGAAFVALARPTLAVLVTGGAASVHWDPDVRAIRERFELTIEQARPALARALVEQLLGARR